MKKIDLCTNYTRVKKKLQPTRESQGKTDGWLTLEQKK